MSNIWTCVVSVTFVITSLGFANTSPGQEYYLFIDIDTSRMSGNPETIRALRTQDVIKLPSMPLQVDVSSRVISSFNVSTSVTYVAIQNGIDQITIKFAGVESGDITIPESPVEIPRIGCFLMSVSPLLDGRILDGKIILEDYQPGKSLTGSFEGKEKLVGAEVYFFISGEFHLPSRIK